ncbi:undecaprenyl-diphosphate phosphatase [Erysipelothrix inopinata]|uniref:Undecaprenyl-diphosphatase n=1 Tax=Erysipelothrix inopinata TaxID=225084 RepID=A0A7G9RZH0_9FIRM|nr:undecaprenyl-diphosphate phosphatase [Erysipelothrix inopinata]QNN60995.1 undecaprenyl-diphosphate phosphatase [Erysipelothrix inopinata]
MNLVEMFKVVILGIVQGITEWLPISSTGHMILVDEFLKLQARPEFMNMFFVVIQFGSILAVVFIYWSKLWPLRRSKEGKVYVKQETMTMWYKIVVACIPAGVIGMLMDEWVDKHLYNPTVVAIMLILFGVIFIVVENRNKGKEPKVNSIAEITYQTAFLIGIFQLIAALFPGTSRSGATIVGALMLGVSRMVATEFTFFLAVPVMFGASILKLGKFFVKGGGFEGAEFMMLSVGMIVAFVVSVVTIKFLLGYIRKNDFKAFGWYRIALGILVLFYFYVLK